MEQTIRHLTLTRPVHRAPPQTTDARLIAGSLKEPERFGLVFDRHWERLHAYCTSRAGAAGEDIAAATFRVAFDERRRYDRKYDDAGPWLYGIATNLLRRHFRAGQRGEQAQRRVRALAELESVPQPFEQLEAQMLGPTLTAALESLAVIDREALLLLAWAELEYEEIARVLDVPVGTVRSRIHRARSKLRAHVDDTTQTQPDRIEGDAHA